VPQFAGGESGPLRQQGGIGQGIGREEPGTKALEAIGERREPLDTFRCRRSQ